MLRARGVPGSAGGHGAAGRLGRLVEEERERLSHWRFWAVQALVVLLAGLHLGLERTGLTPGPYFLPEASFLVPVGYAALNFGMRGSVLTALWCTLLSLPNQFLWHNGRELPGTLIQLGIVNAVAIFVGQRVENEVRERRRAEASHRTLQASENRYRTLFQSSAEALLVCDAAGIIRQANQAAASLLDAAPESLPGTALGALIGRTDGSDGKSAGHGETELVLIDHSGRKVYVEPIRMPLQGDGDEALVQVVLRDVTQHRNRREEWHNFARFMLLGRDDERRRLAHGLHHDLMRTLERIMSELGTAERKAGARAQNLRAIRTDVEDLAAALRHFCNELAPAALADSGLIGSLRELLAKAAARSEIQSSLEILGEQRRLSPDIEQGLYHIAEEALENVERHAEATEVRIGLTFEPDFVHLQVCDNGRGFTVTATRRHLAQRGSLGLIGMEERAAFLGGQFRVDSAPGRGTTVLVDTPA